MDKVPGTQFFIILLFLLSHLAIADDGPLVNTCFSQGVFGLNFSQPGNDQQIAYFIINSNSATGFEITFRFSNRGKFVSNTNEIPMTSMVLDGISGTLGSGLTEPNNIDVLNNLNESNEFIWNPGSEPLSETVNYLIELKSSWSDPVGKLAGFYFETITVTISVGL